MFGFSCPGSEYFGKHDKTIFMFIKLPSISGKLSNLVRSAGRRLLASSTAKDGHGSADAKNNDPHHHHSDHKHPEYKPIVGPGRDPSSIATPYEMTAGLERLEYLSRMSGRPLYLNDPLKVDHYGTLKNPIMVDSIEEDRIVGCTGFPKYSHAPLWMRLKGQTRCLECGQAFQLRRIDQ
jgi:cytochrome c oxidase subunit 5b